MKNPHYTLVNKLTQQAQKEQQFSYLNKQSRITEWKLNEDLYNGKRTVNGETRHNATFGLAHKFVNTFMSKINEPLDFKYERGELGDLRKVKLFNALKDKYKKIGRWDYLDRLGKHNAIMYGVAVYESYGEQDDNGDFVFQNKLVDPNDFFIDPYTSVDDIETARYIGTWGTKYKKSDLEKLLESPNYIKTALREVIAGSDTTDNNETRQDTDKKNRNYSLNMFTNEPQDNTYTFYRWITTNPEDGERYYLVFDNNQRCIRCQKWSLIQKSGLYPYWHWAAFPEPYMFLSRGPLEVIRMILEAQEKNINQVMDNAEKINNPQMVYNVDNLRNFTQLKWKRGTNIEVTGNKTVNDVVTTIQTPQISTSSETYGILDGIAQSVGGVTADVSGVSEAEKVGVYEGNIQQAGDRFALMQNSYEQGYYRLALLFREAVKQHLTKKTVVKIMGSKGYSFVQVTPDSIKMHDNDFDVMISSTSQDTAQEIQKNQQIVQTVNQFMATGILNPKKAFEIIASKVGLEQTEIDALLDTESYLNEEARSYAEENVQNILKGKPTVMYYDADTSYVREFKKLITSLEDEAGDPKVAMKIQEHLGEMMNVIADNEDAVMEDKQLTDDEKSGIDKNMQAEAEMQAQAPQQQMDMQEQQAKIDNLQQQNLQGLQ